MWIYEHKPINNTKQLLNTFFCESNCVLKPVLDKMTEPFLIEIAMSEGLFILDKSNPDKQLYCITEKGKQHRDE